MAVGASNKTKPLITHERLLSLVHYDPETGLFTAKVLRRRFKMKSPLGHVHKLGYIHITLDNRIYKAHRLAWFYVHGEWPNGAIDHRDMDKTNTRLANLREATVSENIRNRRLQKNNRSGFKGVSWSPSKKRWIANIGLNTRLHHLGNFRTKEEAVAAYAKASPRFHGEFARLT